METNRSSDALKQAILMVLDGDEVIPQDRLEKFINNKYHWKALTPSDQMKVAKELYAFRKMHN